MGKKLKGPARKPATPSAEQASFIRINSKIMDDEGLAGHTGLHVDDVRACREQMSMANKGRATSLMDRPRGVMQGGTSGVVAMTEAAAGAADDWQKMGSGATTVTLTDINAARSRGDHAEAERLSQMRDQQERDADTLARARHRDRFHYIDGR